MISEFVIISNLSFTLGALFAVICICSRDIVNWFKRKFDKVKCFMYNIVKKVRKTSK